MDEIIKAENPLQTGLEIAVIGMAGRFPGAANINEFWDNLKNGRESISFFNDEELKEVGVNPGLLGNPNYVKANGMLDGTAYFDASFFGYTPREAEIMDPQVRIFHECVWTALEDAGYDPGAYNGLIGLYAGATPNLNWQARAILSGKTSEIGDFAAAQLIQRDYLTLRISYKLDLKGPSFILYTACSTSLVAIHQAGQAILNGECDMALAGGVTVTRLGKSGYMYQEGMIGSPDGHCKAFDAASKGFVGGDGVGVVVLKRLGDALADRDYIYAVIKGSAVNNDGIRKAGFTAPSVEGQAEVVKMAMQMAEVAPESIGYVETHGTGTELGDPVEIEGLKLAFNTDKKGFCAVGTVKSNVGHLDSAAGAAGFIKAVLALKHRSIPPSLHFEIPNPGIDFINSPFYVSSALTSWENGKYPLRAGVSSLGQGGTNAHVILEEWPAVPSPAPDGQYHLIVFSAKTQPALERMTGNLADYFKRNPGVNLADAAYTLQVGRCPFKYRQMFTCADIHEAVEILSTPGSDKIYTGVVEEGANHAYPEESLHPPVNGPGLRDSWENVGRLWLKGAAVDWNRFYPGKNRYRMPLPTYPFERQRYWTGEGAFKGGEFLLGKNNLEKKPDMADWFYVPTWMRAILPENGHNRQEQSCWLLFLNESLLGDLLVRHLKGSNQKVVVVRPGSGYEAVDPREYTIDPGQGDDYDMLFRELSRSGNVPDNILHCWCAAAPDETELTRQNLDRTQDLGLYSLLNTARAIGKNSISSPVQLGVVTSGMQPVTGEEELYPGKATILGPVKVIPLEYTNIRCRSIDITIEPGPGNHKMEFIAHQLLREFAEGFEDYQVVAYRGSYRWQETYAPLKLNGTPKNGRRLKEKGVYLVTGGLGGMGLTMAENLARRTKARLILVDILDFPPREQWDEWLARDDEDSKDTRQKIQHLEVLEDLGAEILIHQADVSDYEQMKHALSKSQAHFGKINGVVHAAGLIDYAGVIHRRTREMTEEVLAAKVRGTLILNELLEDNPLDFMILFSSLGNLLYTLKFGQVAYNAGHEFLDVFAYFKQKQGTFVTTIDWCDWSEVGMAVRAAEAANLPTDLSGDILAISPAEGMEVFDRILEDNAARVIISARDLGAIVEYIENLNADGSSGAAPGYEDDTQTFYQRPELSTPYKAAANETQEILVNIWQRFFAVKPVGIADDFFELGGDSLKVITVVARIQEELEIQVPIPEFFNTSTIEGIAGYISGKAGKDVPHVLMEIEPAEEREFYPLSSAQMRLYILQGMQQDSIGYNMPNAVFIEGELDTAKLKETFEKLIQRHDSLRTSFEMVNDEPVQRVHKTVNFEIEYDDPGAGTLKPGSLDIDQRVKAFVRAFDLSKAPLLRVGLIRTAEQEHLLMVDMHHIVSDGISMDIFVKEFADVTLGRQLPPLTLQYKDYSVWKHNPEVERALKQQEEYWLKEFSGELPQLNMPLDYKRPPTQSFEGGWVNFGIGKEETTGIKEFARKEDATLFMVLAALYNVLLFKLTSQEDIIVGTGIAGRKFTDLQPLIGMFVNTLALRNYPTRKKTFKTLLKEVKEKALLAFENQDYQFEDLVEKVTAARDWSRNPLFDVVLVLHSQRTGKEAADETDGAESPGLKFRAYDYDNRVSKFDMVLFCDEFRGRLRFTIEYCTKLFKSETIERFSHYFKEIVSNILEDNDIRLEDITISHNLLSAKKSDNYTMELGF